MARSHPPTLLSLVERALREETALPHGSRVLCAVSGGPDSTALLHTLSIVGPRLGLTIGAAGVDHGLRREARQELDQAEALCQELRLRFTRTEVSVPAGSNLQARARAARRSALLELAAQESCSLIATGHHADDRAETVLLRLLRGAGPRGLAVLPPLTPPWVRPMIRARRSDILLHLARHRLGFAKDPSNADRRFVRTRVRHEVLPLLESISPGIVGHLNALADQLTALDASGPVPIVVDDQGTRVPLKRSHTEAIQRALSQGRRGVRVRIPGGRDIEVDGRNGTLKVVPVDGAPKRTGA